MSAYEYWVWRLKIFWGFSLSYTTTSHCTTPGDTASSYEGEAATVREAAISAGVYLAFVHALRLRKTGLPSVQKSESLKE